MTDIIIVGAGIIGMLTAHILSKKGYKVTVIEQGYAGKESTWAGGGIISPLYPWRYSDAVTELAKWSQKNYSELFIQIFKITGIDPEFYRSGLTYLNIDDEKETKHWINKHDYLLNTLTHAELLKKEPELNSEYIKAWNSPNIDQIRNPRVVKALQKLMQISPNITIYEQTKVEELLKNNSKIVGVKTGKQTFYAGKVVIAGGAWSAQLLDGLIDVPKIAPVKGQMIVFKAKPKLVNSIILSDGRYVIPRLDGRILLGSTLEFEGYDKSTPKQMLEELKQQAYRIIPSLKNYEVEKHWAGLRPGAIDGLPYIGEHPQLENLFINAGHFRNGVVLGYASCELLSNIILSEKPILDPSPYNLTSDRMLANAKEIDLEGAI